MEHWIYQFYYPNVTGILDRTEWFQCSLHDVQRPVPYCSRKLIPTIYSSLHYCVVNRKPSSSSNVLPNGYTNICFCFAIYITYFFLLSWNPQLLTHHSILAMQNQVFFHFSIAKVSNSHCWLKDTEFIPQKRQLMSRKRWWLTIHQEITISSSDVSLQHTHGDTRSLFDIFIAMRLPSSIPNNWLLILIYSRCSSKWKFDRRGVCVAVTCGSDLHVWRGVRSVWRCALWAGDLFTYTVGYRLVHRCTDEIHSSSMFVCKLMKVCTMDTTHKNKHKQQSLN